MGKKKLSSQLIPFQFSDYATPLSTQNLQCLTRGNYAEVFCNPDVSVLVYGLTEKVNPRNLLYYILSSPLFYSTHVLGQMRPGLPEEDSTIPWISLAVSDEPYSKAHKVNRSFSEIDKNKVMPVGRRFIGYSAHLMQSEFLGQLPQSCGLDDISQQLYQHFFLDDTEVSSLSLVAPLRSMMMPSISVFYHHQAGLDDLSPNQLADSGYEAYSPAMENGLLCVIFPKSFVGKELKAESLLSLILRASLDDTLDYV